MNRNSNEHVRRTLFIAILCAQALTFPVFSHAVLEEPQGESLTGRTKAVLNTDQPSGTGEESLSADSEQGEYQRTQIQLSPPQIQVEDFLDEILPTSTPYHGWEVIFSTGGPQIFMREPETRPIEIRLLNDRPMPIIPETHWFFERLPPNHFEQNCGHMVGYRYQVIMENHFAFSFYLVRRLEELDQSQSIIKISELEQLIRQFKPEPQQTRQITREEAECCIHSVCCLSYLGGVSLQASMACTLPCCCNLCLPLYCSGVGLTCCTQCAWMAIRSTEQSNAYYHLQPNVVSLVQSCMQRIHQVGALFCCRSLESNVPAQPPQTYWEHPFTSLRTRPH